MAELMFFTETGMFHSACRCTWVGPCEWYGFKPRHHHAPEGIGFVDVSDRTASIKHAIAFDVNDALLRNAVRIVKAKYENAVYVLTVRDCVSFTADIARQAGLRVPRVNFTPYGFVEVLALWNRYTSKR